MADLHWIRCDVLWFDRFCHSMHVSMLFVLLFCLCHNRKKKIIISFDILRRFIVRIFPLTVNKMFSTAVNYMYKMPVSFSFGVGAQAACIKCEQFVSIQCALTTTNVNYNWLCLLSCVAKNSSISSATKYLKCKNNITE